MHTPSQIFTKFPQDLPRQYFGYAAMRDPELTRNVARSDPVVSQFHDPLTHHVGQRSTIDKDTTELVHSSVA